MDITFEPNFCVLLQRLLFGFDGAMQQGGGAYLLQLVQVLSANRSI